MTTSDFKMDVIKDDMRNTNGFKTTILGHFKQEMFPSWAINRICFLTWFVIGPQQLCSKLFLLLDIWVSSFSLSDHYCNLLICKGVNIPSWQIKVLQFHLAHQIPYVMQHEICSLWCEFLVCLCYSNHFTIEGCQKVIFLKNWAWSLVWMYSVKHQ